jgi:hypothetical protein
MPENRRAGIWGWGWVTLLLGSPAVLAWLCGYAYLPRHPGAHDLPWARTSAAAAAQDAPDNRQLADKLRVIYPDYVANARALREGRLPLWNPHVFGGVPHVANPMTAALYPPSWLHALLPDIDIPMFAAGLHLVLGGLFMLSFLRVAGLMPIAALFGALAFALSGWIASHLQNTPLVATIVWVPLGWAGVEAIHRGLVGRGVLALGLGVGVPWLAGFPQLAALGNVAIAIYAAVSVVARTRSAGARAGLRRCSLLGVCVLAGWLLAGAQLAPTFEAMPHSARGSRTTADLATEHLRWPVLLGLALPRTLGDPMIAGDWRDQATARALLGEGEANLPAPVGNWGERTIYAGALVLLLALYGAVRAPRALVTIAGAGIALAGSTTLIEAYGRVPGFDFGAPARAIVLTALALPALAGFGLQRALSDGWPVRARTLLALALVASGIALGGAPPTGLRTDLLAIAAVLVALAGLLRLPARWHGGGAVALATVDLAAFFVPVNLPVPRAELFAKTPALRFLAGHASNSRFLRVSGTAAEAVADRLDLLHPNLGTLHRLNDAQGYRELAPARYLALWEGLAPLTSPIGFVGLTAAAVQSRVLDVAAVGQLLAARPVPELIAHQVHPPAGQVDADLFVYANDDALPRAWIARRASIADDATARARIRSGAVDLSDEVLVDRLPLHGAEAPAVHARARVVHDTGDELRVEVACDGAGFLVLADTWFPGWQAEAIDRAGQTRALEIVRAMSCQRAVAVDASVATVVFRYRPVALRIGFACSAIGALGLMLLAWRAARLSAAANPSPHLPQR